MVIDHRFVIPFTFLMITIANFGQSAEPTKGELLFAINVKNLFAQKCNACHGDDPSDIQGGLNLLSRDGAIAGGDEFAVKVLIPKHGNESYLYRVTTREEPGFEMPPKEAERLTQEQTWWIRDWINEGAPWPSDERVTEIQAQYASGEIVKTSGGLSEDWTNRRYKPEHLWAYRPLDVQQVPDEVNPIDFFIDGKLEKAGLQPAPPASAGHLMRRISFGLTGLPVDSNDKKTFLQNYSRSKQLAAKTYAAKLMNTPAYGEHFGRQWLDVARYADSAGFANDYSRPNAWRYRDYVIRAFNEDKPYNEFVNQQIAGDEIDDQDPENVIATGFLRMGPWEQTSMSVFRVTRQQWLDDVTDSVGQTFLGHALQCAKCHDHKFDPIPTRDYYSMMAVFTTTQFAERDTPFLKSENKSGFKPIFQWTKEKIAAYQKQRDELNARVAKQRQQESTSAKVGDNGLDPGDEASLARMAKNILRHGWELDKTKPIAFAVYTGKTIERKNVGKRIPKPAKPWSKGEIEKDTILTGGDAFTRGDNVMPSPLSAVQLAGMPVPNFDAGQAKRRLALAKWISDQRNPLTARVIVNRVWTWHFGKGLAGNPNNFGATGRLPTHPKLLDYLADWFMKNDWSIKNLNRLIVQSKTYSRSSVHAAPAELAEKDPKRDLYAAFQPRRLTAEEIRDAMLWTSGELNPQVGGVPCRPDLNLEVAMQPRQIMGGTASVYEPDPLPKQRNRRSVYAEKIRGVRDPFLETFNQPGPDKSCELRETSTVAPQALTMLNATEVQERSRAFAMRLMKETGDQKKLINRAFELALGRLPTNKEQTLCQTYWQSSIEAESAKTYQAAKYPAQITRTVMAEKTGEPYDFVEIMPAYKNYVPDLQPTDLDAKTRALASVCLVIFNMNEFAYID